MTLKLLCFLMMGPACLLALTHAAADNGRPHPTAHNPIKPMYGLLDTYIQLLKPSFSVAPKQSGRAGRTTLQVKLEGPSSVNQYAPTVAPEVRGTVVDVLHTWDAFKSMAVAFRKADKVNKLSPKKQPLFPKTSQATRLASIAPLANASNSAIAAAELTAASLVGFPPNLLMVPFGHTTGAIADLTDVSYDEKADSVTLQLDVVQNPVTFSQFVDHAAHSVDTAAAHYHLLVRDSMHVDAPALLKSLEDSSYKVEGVHVFLKSEPLEACYVGTITTDTETPEVGQTVNVTIEVVFTCREGRRAVPDGLELLLEVIPDTGDGDIIQTSPDTSGSVITKRKRAPSARERIAFAYILDNFAWAVIRPNRAGPFRLEVSINDQKKPLLLGDITITATPAMSVLPPVAKLLLQPHKAYRRCGDPVSLTAVALYANHTPVAGVNVTFAVYGDCAPEYVPFKLTDSQGRAQVDLKSYQPGAVAVVAAVNSINGIIIISEPAHVIFFEEHGDADRREREYFGDRGDEDSPGRHHDEEEERRDAWRYEREAAKLAEQRALGAPVSGSL